MTPSSFEEAIIKQGAKLEFLEGKVNSMAESMSLLATDMRQLAISQAKRDEDMQSLRRVFERIEALEEGQQAIKTKMQDEIIARQQEIIDAHNRASARIRGELIRTIGAVIAALILYHFGVTVK